MALPGVSIDNEQQVRLLQRPHSTSRCDTSASLCKPRKTCEPLYAGMLQHVEPQDLNDAKHACMSSCRQKHAAFAATCTLASSRVWINTVRLCTCPQYNSHSTYHHKYMYTLSSLTILKQIFLQQLTDVDQSAQPCVHCTVHVISDLMCLVMNVPLSCTEGHSAPSPWGPPPPFPRPYFS